LTRHLLAALDQEKNALPARRLESLLGLEPPLLRHLVQGLLRDGLIAAGGQENAGDLLWSITPAGRQALEDGGILRQRCERRWFTFIDGGDSSRPTAHVSVTCSEWGVPLAPAPGEVHFKRDDLRACISQSPQWKLRRGFAADILDLCNASAGSPPWRHVVIDRPELCLALIMRDAEGIHGFAVRTPGWTLQAEKPCFSLSPEDALECFPQVAVETSLDDWRQAFQAWGQARHLPLPEPEALALEPAGMHLRIRADGPLADKLRGYLAKGEGWLLAGSGGWRACGCLEIVDR
jgi:hypothetical protein